MARADIIKIMKTKEMSPLDFKFEQLQAPPILSLLTVQDIYNLNRIAKSIKYTSKIQLKYEMIDKIMTSRGFVRFHRGTNRIAYRHLECTGIIAKVAVDQVGLRDTPDEYRNQFLLKPFVTKVFECSPCGTIGFFERVQPITSREEFVAIAPDIFELLNKFIIGKYVLEDIGTSYFMNYGLRDGFGAVLLDFPYVFELDGGKLYCNNTIPELNDAVCGGTIDYDSGFNNLICSKCGKRHLATELKKEESSIGFFSEKGGTNMKVMICKGYGRNKKIVERTATGSKTIYKETSNNKKQTLTEKLSGDDDRNKLTVKVVKSTQTQRMFNEFHQMQRELMNVSINHEVRDASEDYDKSKLLTFKSNKVDPVIESNDSYDNNLPESVTSAINEMPKIYDYPTHIYDRYSKQYQIEKMNEQKKDIPDEEIPKEDEKLNDDIDTTIDKEDKNIEEVVEETIDEDKEEDIIEEQEKEEVDEIEKIANKYDFYASDEPSRVKIRKGSKKDLY